MKELSQIVVENTYSKKNIRSKIMKELVQMDNGMFEDKIDKACEAIQAYFTGKYYASKNRRVDHLCQQNIEIDDIVYEILMIILPVEGYQTVQSVCGQLAGKLGFPNIFDGIKTAGELITVVCSADLYDMFRPEDSITGSVIIENVYSLSDELMQYISNVKYLPPMICKPNILKGNWDTGYKTITDSVILKGKTHEGDQALDAINISNQTTLSLDLRMLELEETPKHELETVKQEEAFKLMKTSSRTVYDDLLEEGNEFYLNHKRDERGRKYAQGYHCSYQSSQYKRSLINLAKKELIV